MMKKLLLLCLLMLLSLGAYAHDIEVANTDGVTIYYVFTNDNSELAVSFRGDSFSSYSGEYSGNVVIPESVTLNGIAYPVTSIEALAFAYCSGLTGVEIPSSITTIKFDQFVYCPNLSSITVSSGNSKYDSRNNCNAIIETASNTLMAGCRNTIIPNTVTSIGFGAFSGYTSLTSVTIPNSVISIGGQAFYGCSGLTSVTIPNSVTSIDVQAFYGCSGLTSVYISDLTSWCNIRFSDNPLRYAHHLYLNGEEIKDLAIPNSVTSIGNSVFSGCSGLTSVTIPTSVTSIGSYAFSSCTCLTSMDIPNSVTSIGEAAFSGCSGLTSVTIPNSVTSIGEAAFYGCSCLTSVTIPNSVKSIGSSAFSGCKGLKSLTIPNSVTSIGNSVFSGCSCLTSVTIPNSVTSIGEVAFSGCSGLTSVTIPNSVKSIGSSAFYGCKGLKSLTIPNSVTSIGNSAFSGCSGLTSIIIPNFVTSIGNSAFSGCSGLTSVTIPNSVTTIGSQAFARCTGLTSVTIPHSVTNIGEAICVGCSSLTSIKVPITDYSTFCNNTFVSLINSVIGKPIILIDEAGNEIKDLSITGNVASIGRYAFQNCSGLTSVTIPNSVISIDDYAFSGCSGLTNVNLSNSVKNIGSDAFNGCTGLSSITFPNSLMNISDNAFSGCSNLTSIAIPNSVKNIGKQAFQNCSNLTSVNIGNSLTSIGVNAFEGTNWYNSQPEGLVYIDKVAYKYKGTMPSNTSIALNEGTICIADETFSGCSGLTSVTIPSSVMSIGNRAFYGCSGLKSVTIPKSVTSIGDNAFNGCSILTKVQEDSKTPIWISDVFSTYSYATLYVPKGCKAAYATAQYWKDFSSIVEMEGDETPSSGTEGNYANESNALVSISFSPQEYIDGLGAIKFNSLSYTPARSGTSGHNYSGNRLLIDNGLAEGYYWLNPTDVNRNSIDEENIVFRSSITGSTPYYGTNTPVAFAGISTWGYRGQKGLIQVKLRKTITGSLNLGTNSSGGNQFYSVSMSIPRKNYDSEGNVTGTSIIVSDNAILVENEFSVKIAYSPWGNSQQTLKWNRPSDTTTELNNYRYHHFADSATIWNQTIGTGHLVFQEVASDRGLDVYSLVTGCTHEEGTPWDTDYGAGITTTHNWSNEIMKAQLKTYGLSFRFAIPTTGYSTGADNSTNQQEFATIDAIRGILRPNGNLEACVGKEPIIRIMLMDTVRNKLVDERYMKIRWSEPIGGSEQTLDLAEIPALTYGATSYTLPQKTIEGLSLGWSIEDTSLAKLSGNVLTVYKAGTTTLTAVNYGNNTYLPFTRTFTLTVNKAPLTITANDCMKEQGKANPELTVSYSGFINGDDASVLTTQPIVSTTATTSSPVGTYPITVSGAEAENYDFTYVNGTLTVVDEIVYNNHLYANAVMLRSGKEQTIALQLDNENAFIACEFYLQLPDGISIEKDEDDYLVADIVSERSNRHAFEARDEGNGLYHFLCYSTRNNAFKGNSGDFITLSLVADDDLAPSDYSAEIKDIIFSDENKTQFTLVNSTFNITVVNYTLGDVNDDGKINVMDVVEMVGYIMSDSSDNFVFAAADIDGNNTVNVMDLVNLVEMIMTIASQAPEMTTFAQDNMATCSGLAIDRVDEKTITMSIPDATNHIAAQFIVSLSGKAVLKDVVSDKEHHTEFTRMDDGRYMVMVYSGNNASFRNDSSIQLLVYGACSAKIEDVVFIDSDKEPVTYESATIDNIMAIGSVFDQPTDIYSVSGKLIKKDATSTQGLAKGVYIVNNEKVIVK